MEFSVKHGPIEKQRSACLVVGVHEKHKLSAAATALDAACGGAIGRTLKGNDIKGKAGDTLLIIEAMKVMNPIKADKAGTVTEILVDDAQPVEFGQPLMIIE